jgi:hypothetical protein
LRRMLATKPAPHKPLGKKDKRGQGSPRNGDRPAKI